MAASEIRSRLRCRDMNGSFAPHVGRSDQLRDFPRADIDDDDTGGRSCAPTADVAARQKRTVTPPSSFREHGLLVSD